MKKDIFVLGALMLGALGGRAQFSENFNSYSNRGPLVANCWEFFGTDVSSSSAISGNSTRSGQASSLTSKKEVRTPFLNIQAGATVTFVHKISAYRTQDSRMLDVVLVDENGVESAPIYTHTYTSGSNVTASFSVGTTGTYRIAMQHYGNGGQGRGHIDNFEVTNATYASDPSNNCLPLALNPDSDGDGVADAQDEFPADPTLAFSYATTVGYGSFAFEDLWPFKGDYDFNDLVVDFKVTLYLNAQNQVKFLRANFVTTAVGGVLIDGLAVNFPDIARSQITSVTGQVLNGYTSNSNGTENGQSNAVVVVYDNVEDVINRAGATFFNTVPNEPVGSSDTLRLQINFSSPLSADLIGTADVFAFKGGNRGFEIHRPNKAPTDLADLTVLGTGDDNSNASNARYYVTQNNLPWVIETPERFVYPTEKTDIVQAYLNFASWAQSNGSNHADWYTNKAGNRDNSKIFE